MQPGTYTLLENIPDVGSCILHCELRDSCSGIEYNERTKACELHDSMSSLNRTESSRNCRRVQCHECLSHSLLKQAGAAIPPVATATGNQASSATVVAAVAVAAVLVVVVAVVVARRQGKFTEYELEAASPSEQSTGPTLDWDDASI